MQLCEIGSVILVLVAGLGCGPDPLPADDGTESSTQGDVDGDGDGDGDAGDGDGDPSCGAELGAEIEPMLADLQVIVDGTIAYFEAEHPSAEDPDIALHRCPHPAGGPSAGQAGYTPEIALNCNAAPDCLCTPALGGGDVGSYDLSLWTDNSVWQGVGFSKQVPHAFHYNLEINNVLTGYGACTFTARAVGDFDDDGVFSTYERRGTLDENGVTLEPLDVELMGE